MVVAGLEEGLVLVLGGLELLLLLLLLLLLEGDVEGVGGGGRVHLGGRLERVVRVLAVVHGGGHGTVLL